MDHVITQYSVSGEKGLLDELMSLLTWLATNPPEAAFDVDGEKCPAADADGDICLLAALKALGAKDEDLNEDDFRGSIEDLHRTDDAVEFTVWSGWQRRVLLEELIRERWEDLDVFYFSQDEEPVRFATNDYGRKRFPERWVVIDLTDGEKHCFDTIADAGRYVCEARKVELPESFKRLGDEVDDGYLTDEDCSIIDGLGEELDFDFNYVER